jgi:hypothetical protein
MVVEANYLKFLTINWRNRYFVQNYCAAVHEIEKSNYFEHIN